MSLTKEDLDAIQDLMRVTIKEVAVTKEELHDAIKHLPTKDEFYKSQDELMTELKTIREEQTVQSQQILRNTKRIEKVEDKLQIASI